MSLLHIRTNLLYGERNYNHLDSIHSVNYDKAFNTEQTNK